MLCNCLIIPLTGILCKINVIARVSSRRLPLKSLIPLCYGLSMQQSMDP